VAAQLVASRAVLSSTELVKLDVGETGWCGMHWADLTQDREEWKAVMNMVKHIWVL
jgi:hypothetical protein